MQARLDEMERLSPGIGLRSGAFWDERADRFAARLPVEEAGRDPFLRRVRRAAHPTSTVIDVGAGAGRFALQLAPDVEHVTAVDLSSTMLGVLRRHADELGARNVTTVQGRWEEVDVGQADLVLCAFVLPLVADARRFVAKLHRAARRRVFLYLGAFSRDAVLDPLWRHFHGAPRRPGPTYLDALNVLRELGIAPEVRVVEVVNRTRFATAADAVDDYRDHLLLPDTPEVRRELEDLLASWLVGRRGALRPPLRAAPAAIVNWRP